MKRIKKILSIVFVLAIMASVCIVPASAAVKDEYETCASQCDICGGSNTTITNYGSYSVWKTVGSYTCIHHKYGTDAKQESTRKLTVRCYNCGGEYIAIEARYRRGTCYGYDS